MANMKKELIVACIIQISFCTYIVDGALAQPKIEGGYRDGKTSGMKALQCKTLGGNHIHHALSHIEQQVPRTFHTKFL